MTRFLTILVMSIGFLLTGCATHEKYYEAVKSVEEAKANAQAAQATAIMKLAGDGDAQAKGMALMFFAMQGAKAGGNQTVMAPPVDPVLEWVRVLAGPVTNLWGIVENNRTQRHASDNSVALQQINMGTLGNVANTAITQPPVVIGPTEGFGTLYPTN